MAALTRRTDAQTDKRRRTEQEVVAATERLLDGGASYAELSVERIAREAGISRTAFYFYFRDKRELLMRCAEDVVEQLYASAAAWWGSGDDGEAALESTLRALVALFRAHSSLLRAVIEASTFDEPVSQTWTALVGRFVEATRERIVLEQARGRAQDLDPEPTAFALAWMTERAVFQQLAQGREDDEALVRALAATWRRTIYPT